MERRKYHVILSLSISRPSGYRSFSPRNSCHLPCLVCVLTAWLGDGQAEGPSKYGRKEMWIELHLCQSGSTASSQGNSLSLFLWRSPGVAQEARCYLLHLSLRMPPVSRGCSVPSEILCSCVSWNLTRYLKGFLFERILMWLNCPMLAKLEASIQSLIGMFLKAFPLS